MLKLLIFDLDGTLADTGQDIADALNYALNPYGVQNYSVEEVKSMVGSGIASLLESLVPTSPPFGAGDSVNAGELVTNRFLKYYSEHLMDNTTAYPYVKDTLSSLGDYKMAVLTNKREKYSRQILDELELLEYFDLVWGSDSVREKKPSPVPILDMMKKFGTNKEETMIIGDSNFDVEAGMAAGIKVVGVTYGFRSRAFLKGSDYIIDSFNELMNIIPRITEK